MNKKDREKYFDRMEKIINLYEDENVKWKIEFIKTFLKEYFQVDDFDNSYIKIERLHSKSLMWLLVSLIVEYDTMKQNPHEQLSKQNKLFDSTSQKLKIPEKTGMQEKFKSLEVKDIFLVDELTEESVQFIEKFLEKTNVDLEDEANFKFVITTNQMIYLLRKVMQDYKTFLSNREKLKE